MYGFGYSIPSTSDLNKAARQAEELAKQAQKSAEKAQQIADAAKSPPVPRPPSPTPAPVVESGGSVAQFFKAYAIPIVAVSTVVVFGVYLWRKS